MKISELQDTMISDALVDQILFADLKNDRGQFADAAIVLGSSKAHLYRLPPVAEAYREGRVKRIVVSGHTRSINGREINEGMLLKEKALEMGVGEDDVLVESRAENTWENIIFSKSLLRQKGLFFPGMTIALATSSYHMRRSLCIAERVFVQDNVSIISLPGEDRSTRRDTWYTNEKGRRRCYAEVSKIICSVRQGSLKDWELS